MQKLYISLLLIITVISSCKKDDTTEEVIKSEPKIAGDTTYMEAPEAKQDKVVLFEKFSAVRSANEPEADKLLEEVIMNNPNSFFIINMHAGSVANPYETGKHDYRSAEATSIANQFGLLGPPSALIDRVKFQDENERIIFTTSWKDKALLSLNKKAPVNIYLKTLLDELNNTLYVIATIKLTEDIAEPLNLSVGLVESNLVSKQQSKNTADFPPSGIIPDYTHNNILRTMSTDAIGIRLNVPNQKAGRVIVKRLEINFKDKPWELANCKVYAFVHKAGTTEEVLQVQSINAK